MDYIVLAFLWFLWAFLHSLLIADKFYNQIIKFLGTQKRFFRLLYNIFAIFSIIPVVIYAYSLNGPLIYNWTGYSLIIQLFLILLAVYLFIAGARHYSFPRFSGLAQVREQNQNNLISSTGKLDNSGIMKIIRHPWYSGALILLWSRAVDLADLITNSVLSLYLIVGTYIEERKLLREFGQDYEVYRQKVSMFIPVKWILKKLRIRGT